MNDNTKFKELINSVFMKIKDTELAQLQDDIACEIVTGYIKPACIKFQSCTDQDLSNRDDILGEFGFKLSDENFEILSNYMIISWIDSHLLSTNMLKSRLSSNDFKSLNLQQQLSRVMQLRSMLKAENDQLAINKSYKGSELFDLVLKRKQVTK